MERGGGGGGAGPACIISRARFRSGVHSAGYRFQGPARRRSPAAVIQSPRFRPTNTTASVTSSVRDGAWYSAACPPPPLSPPLPQESRSLARSPLQVEAAQCPERAAALSPRGPRDPGHAPYLRDSRAPIITYALNMHIFS